MRTRTGKLKTNIEEKGRISMEKKIQLRDYIKNHSELLSTFGIFITGAAVVSEFVPGIIGKILSCIFWIICVYILDEIIDTFIEADFKEYFTKLLMIPLAAILSLFIVHLGLYFLNINTLLPYFLFFVAIFIFLIVIAICCGSRKIQKRWILITILITIILLSFLISLGLYLGHKEQVNNYFLKHYSIIENK